MPELKHCPNFDVLIIGGGAAGLYTALSLPTTLRVALVTKDTLKQSASDWAQGGIAAAIRQDDSPKLHAQDTFNAGVGLCDSSAVHYLVENAQEQINHLLEMGVAFDRQQQELALTLEAAHSKPRVLHAADATGKALIKTLRSQVLIQANIQVFSEFFSLGLWLNPKTQRCGGISAYYQKHFIWVFAPIVILATGGGGQVFSQTTNPPLSTGDGVSMAWRAGVQLRDLEFFQFHPTALTLPGAPRFLISEAVRGEGAQLKDSNSYRFMFDYHSKGELAPRDVVSRSIFQHLLQTQANQVWLDLRPIPPDQIKRRFPKIVRYCQSWGLDVFSESIPVSPAAHYWMGGVATNLSAQTSLPGLYAVGEVSSTGVHGANRLASNSLLECLVFGAALAEAVQKELKQLPSSSIVRPHSKTIATLNGDFQPEQLFLNSIRQQLPPLIWKSAGICREPEQMLQALEQVQTWRKQFSTLSLTKYIRNLQQTPGVIQSISSPQLHLRFWGEVENLLDVAYLILKSATFRTESRGGHNRTDFPKPSQAWQAHTLIEQGTWFKSDPIH